MVVSKRNFFLQFLSEFDQFKKINLWLGSSGPAKHTATHLANQLGLKRCYLVR